MPVESPTKARARNAGFLLSSVTAGVALNTLIISSFNEDEVMKLREDEGLKLRVLPLQVKEFEPNIPTHYPDPKV
jgi:hypothetical protein